MFTVFIAHLVGTDLPLLTADNSMTIPNAFEETKNMPANYHGICNY